MQMQLSAATTLQDGVDLSSAFTDVTRLSDDKTGFNHENRINYEDKHMT